MESSENSDYKYYIDHIQHEFKGALNAHQEQLSRVQFQLQGLLMSSKHKKALEDKERILYLQKAEFLRSYQNTINRLVEAKENVITTTGNTAGFCEIAEKILCNFKVERNRLADSLPIYSRRSDILDTVTNNQVTVVIGETGSGKSTQMTQYFYEAGLADSGMIVCTQPRKVAATSLAVHVAKEMGTSVGNIVGYKAGALKKLTRGTKILYITDHSLVRECYRDRTLSKYSCIIVDEVHERRTCTDLLLGILKYCLNERPELRVVITSASIDPEVFVEYFVQCPVLQVSGRKYPVEVVWEECVDGQDSFDDYQEKSVRKAIEVHKSEGKGDILVFVTSPLETEMCSERFQELMRCEPDDYVILQLHGKLQHEEYQKAFDPDLDRKRKIVFATNSAETSVTIPNVKYVIDTGLVKEMKFDPVHKISSLTVTMVTQSSAAQRQGRAGRLGPGKCFRLYSEEDFSKMNVNTQPEILRSHFAFTMLQLIELGFNPREFDYVTSPSVDAIDEAFATLVILGAIEENHLSNLSTLQNRITDLGRWIAKMPFDPKYGAFVYESIQAGIGVEAIVVTAASESGLVLYTETDRRKYQTGRLKFAFCHEGSDQLTVLKVYRKWCQVDEREKRRWCWHHYVNARLMDAIRDRTEEVLEILRKEMRVFISIALNESKHADELLTQLLFKTFHRNLSHLFENSRGDYNVISKKKMIEIHSSSVVHSNPSLPEWIVFDQAMRTNKDFAMQVTAVPESLVMKGIDDGWLKFNFTAEKEKCLNVMMHRHMGKQMFAEVVGPNCTNLRNMEAKLASEFPDTFVTLKVNQRRGTLTLLSDTTKNSKTCTSMKRSLSCNLGPLQKKFISEESEECLGRMKPPEASVRAVIGSGGVTSGVLMPGEFRVVQIHCSGDITDKWNEELVLRDLRKYGQIVKHERLESSQTSTLVGQATFKDPDSAKRAVAGTQGFYYLKAQSNVADFVHTKDELTTMIQCCRKSSKVQGFVEFMHRKAYQKAVQHKHCMIGGSQAKVEDMGKYGKTVLISEFGQHVTEEDLCEAFVNVLHFSPEGDIKRVAVEREEAKSDKEVLDAIRQLLVAKIAEFARPETFHLEFEEPRSEEDSQFIAYCTFAVPEEGVAACMAINNEFLLNGEAVLMKNILHSSLFIPVAVYKEYRDTIGILINKLQTEEMQIRLKNKNRGIIVDLITENSPECRSKLVTARGALEKAIRGDTIGLKNNHDVLLLFRREGREIIQSIMNETGVLIIADDRLKAVTLHGSLNSKISGRVKIEEYLKQFSDGSMKTIEFEASEMPAGAIKALVQKYGTDLVDLRHDAGLALTEVLPGSQGLILTGKDEAIKRAVTKVQEVMTKVSIKSHNMQNKLTFDCVICCCPIEKEDFYKVECCGHNYCRECMQIEINASVANKTFPMMCGDKRGGLKTFVWRDFVNLSRRGFIKLQSLVSASVNSFVLNHKSSYSYCPTPCCPTVYKVTNMHGTPFVCPECHTKICTQCKIPYHSGFTCEIKEKANSGFTCETKKKANSAFTCEIKKKANSGFTTCEIKKKANSGFTCEIKKKAKVPKKIRQKGMNIENKEIGCVESNMVPRHCSANKGIRTKQRKQKKMRPQELQVKSKEATLELDQNVGNYEEYKVSPDAPRRASHLTKVLAIVQKKIRKKSYKLGRMNVNYKETGCAEWYMVPRYYRDNEGIRTKQRMRKKMKQRELSVNIREAMLELVQNVGNSEEEYEEPSIVSWRTSHLARSEVTLWHWIHRVLE